MEYKQILSSIIAGVGYVMGGLLTVITFFIKKDLKQNTETMIKLTNAIEYMNIFVAEQKLINIQNSKAIDELNSKFNTLAIDIRQEIKDIHKSINNKDCKIHGL